VVLLASFGRFIPEGKAGRRLRLAIEAMAGQLRSNRGETMLADFLARAAAPADPALLSPTPFESGLSAIGRQRLSQDLDALGQTAGLPDGFPHQARVLLVEAGSDQIVEREASEALAACLPQADRITLQGAGHCFLGSQVLPMVLAWLEPLG